MMMQKEPILLILAAGMGSRYGGLKQIDALGPNGEILMDYSLYDARRAGFKRVVFIIKKEDEAAFDAAIGSRIKKFFEVQYAFQSLKNIPEGETIPEGRVKPWGTAHALLAACDLIDAPFAVINADDYYGPEAYRLIYHLLCEEHEKDSADIITYVLGHTLSPNGHVARGLCRVENGYLREIVERRMVKEGEGTALFSEDGGRSWEKVALDSPVSMNFWGFSPEFMQTVEAYWPKFFREAVPANPLKSEYLLPSLIGELLAAEKIRVRVHISRDHWFGVTYHEDKESVMQALREKITAGVYPAELWRV